MDDDKTEYEERPITPAVKAPASPEGDPGAHNEEGEIIPGSNLDGDPV